MEWVDKELVVVLTLLATTGTALYNVLKARSDSKTNSGRLGLDGWRELTLQLRGRIDDLHKDIREVEAQRDHALRWLRYHETRAAVLELKLRANGVEPPTPPDPPTKPV